MTPKPTSRQLHAGVLDDQHATLMELAQTLVGFETQNPPGHTRAIIDWIETYLHELGIETD